MVYFETTGTADLVISGFNGTTFGEVAPDDLKFLQLWNGTDYLTPEIDGNSIIYEDYSGSAQGAFEVSEVLTSGMHTLEFRFGDGVMYAYNQAHAELYRTVYDGIYLDDYVTQQCECSRTVTETLSLDDNATGVVNVSDDIDDIIRYTATALLFSAKYTRTVTEFLPLADQVTPSADTSRIVTETLPLADKATLLNAISRTVTEFLPLNDEATTSADTSRLVTEFCNCS